MVFLHGIKNGDNVIVIRSGVSTSLLSMNPTLFSGEPCVEIDTGKFKIGDGVTPWSMLAYINPQSIGVDSSPVFYTLKLNSANQIAFTTPTGASVLTKIAIPLFAIPEYGQIIMLGVKADSFASARAISMCDARAFVHQPTISLFDPAEGQSFGLSWDGGSTTAYLKTHGWNERPKIGIRVTDAFASVLDLLTLDSATGRCGLYGVVSPSSALDIGAGAITIASMSAPSAPAPGKVVLYCKIVDGKTGVYCKFPDSTEAKICGEV